MLFRNIISQQLVLLLQIKVEQQKTFFCRNDFFFFWGVYKSSLSHVDVYEILGQPLI
jgi:hypothetical protein